MEFCMEIKALKSSLLRELATKSTQQAFFEDFPALNTPAVVSSDQDFSVDCFLDFSNGEFKDGYAQEEEEEEKDSLSVSSQDPVNDDINYSSISDSFLASELAVPTDEIAELEWVSHFVDDSLSDVSLLVPACKGKLENHAKNRVEPEPRPSLSKTTVFPPSRVPSKARTKRSRPTGRTWSGSSNQTETPSSSASSTSSMPCLVSANSVQTIDSLSWLSEPPMKKPKKRPAAQTSGLMASPQFQRRCSHCQVQKTPQWRTGPLGAKTLCNACGVRYKSGRLFPEYRPACSPTFSSEVHSNSHRKVLEMRKKKDTGGPESRLSHMVPSF
ncbi:GATA TRANSCRIPTION FACTOR [Salix purpurea]|uniref:GATA transcription factor n=1 Tax=Salix purpurea TaxID=77065 RepID=A0A9Q0WGK2_SALPP|nr:GATA TRANSCRIPTION FACTOR [Salix purpurea]KAJ6766011.1 GATA TRANSCRIPTION FACTOR [Salix purpurea]